MFLDQPTAALLTRLTARVSALLFIAWILRHGWLRWRGITWHAAARAQRSLFLVFAAAHFLHLAALLALAAATQGQNIELRGGWLRVSLTGGLIYLAIAVLAAAQVNLIPGAARIRSSPAAERTVALLAWIGFMMANTGRAFQSAYHALITLLLTAGFLFYVLGSRLRATAQSPADS